MSSEPSGRHAHPCAQLYDEEYFSTRFAHGPYGRGSKHWMDFFGRIADFIVDTFHPRRVLDAGCAMGLLVEALRDRGVEAFGCDISAYALSQVREDLKPYFSEASVAERLRGDYDLVTCIEVLEHVTQQEATAAIAQFAAHASAVLFSSTPRDFTEPTHINVRPIEYWIQQFRREGFHLDLGTDASVVCPHALVFRKTPPGEAETLSFIVRSVDRAIDLQELRVSFGEVVSKHTAELKTALDHAKEVDERLRAALEELRHAKLQAEEQRQIARAAMESVAAERTALEQARREAESLGQRGAELERALAAEQGAHGELMREYNLIKVSRAWRWIERLRRVKLRGFALWRSLSHGVLAPVTRLRKARVNLRRYGEQMLLDAIPFVSRR